MRIKLPFSLFLAIMILPFTMIGQTVIPNPGFETWTTTGNYTNPTGWDTPNQELMSIPFFGFSVVTKSTDHQGTGSFSAKLETKHLSLPPLDVPGFLTCGTLTVDIATASYTLSGGVPVVDQPTHLKGFYKFLPKGGDSCVVGIGLTKWNGTSRDSVAYGYFSTKDTVPDWTPFSAWIYYESLIIPDTMNIIAMSTAQEVMTPGTTLWIDNLFLDYTVGKQEQHEAGKFIVYQDRETSRLLIFPDQEGCWPVTVRLTDMRGVTRFSTSLTMPSDRIVIPCGDLQQGIFLVEMMRGSDRFTKKVFINQ